MINREAYSSLVLPLLDQMQSITLDQMHGIRLMNRTDTKFVTDFDHLYRMVEKIRDTYYVQEVDCLRVADYQTVYLDLPDHGYYVMHHNGKFPRQKVRVRTYRDSDISFLEIKRKNNHGRTRKVRMMVPDPDRLLEAGSDLFLNENLHVRLSELNPTLVNHFQRITFVNVAKTERLTIDLDLHFHNLETGVKVYMGNLVIIELKRDGHLPSPVLPVLRELRIRPLGFSKYCIGSALTNAALKCNRFKRRIHDIQKRTKGYIYS